MLDLSGDFVVIDAAGDMHKGKLSTNSKERLMAMSIHQAVQQPDPYFHNHVCGMCSDGIHQGRGCVNCRNTGMDQSPCLNCPGSKEKMAV